MIYESAAKINLTLDTLFKRDDGFHEVEMIMTTIDLNDRLSFERDKTIRLLSMLNKLMFPLIVKFGI